MNTKKWYESKAIWASICICITTVGAFLSGRADLGTTVTTCLMGLGIAGLRLGDKIVK